MILDQFKNSFIRSFGRRKTTSLTSSAKKILEDNYASIYFNNDNLAELVKKLKLYDNITLEIGFGSGEYVVHQAVNYPDTTFIACDVWINGCARLLQKTNNNNLKNIIVFSDDVRFLLTEMQKPFIQSMYVLFPDPWHKKRHFKRRIINHNNLNLFSKYLNKDASILFGTDVDSYYEYALEAFESNNNFYLDEKYKFNPFNMPSDHLKTKYQLKAEMQNKKSKFILARKL